MSGYAASTFFFLDFNLVFSPIHKQSTGVLETLNKSRLLVNQKIPAVLLSISANLNVNITSSFEKCNQWRQIGLKGSQLGAFCPQAIVYCYLEFKLRYLKNLKLFSIRVKELFELIVLRNRRRVFALFKSILLRNRSLSNGSWFYGKKRKIGKTNLYSTENRLSRK